MKIPGENPSLSFVRSSNVFVRMTNNKHITFNKKGSNDTIFPSYLALNALLQFFPSFLILLGFSFETHLMGLYGLLLKGLLFTVYSFSGKIFEHSSVHTFPPNRIFGSRDNLTIIGGFDPLCKLWWCIISQIARRFVP